MSKSKSWFLGLGPELRRCSRCSQAFSIADVEIHFLNRCRGWLYLARGELRATARPVWKIGYTESDPSKRIKAVRNNQTVSRVISDVTEVARRRGTRKLESRLHRDCDVFSREMALLLIELDYWSWGTTLTEWFAFPNEEVARENFSRIFSGEGWSETILQPR